MNGITTLLDQVAVHASKTPDAVALRQKRYGIWQELDWAGLRGTADALAAGLMELGFQPGDHAGILSENRAEWVLAQLGVMAAGGVTVGMYPTSPAAELRHLVTASDTKLLFIEDQEQLDKIKALDGELPLLHQLIIFEPRGTRSDRTLNLTTFEDLLSSGHAALDRHTEKIAARKSAVAANDTAMMVFTSGSTGPPKAAEISHANFSVALEIADHLFHGYPQGTNILSYLPLCHIAEQNMTVVNALSGRRVMNFGESLRTVTRDLRDVAPEIFFGVPRIWEKMRATIIVQAKTTGPLRGALTEAALNSAQSRGAVRRCDWSLGQRLAFTLWDLVIYRHIRAYLGLSHCKFAMSAAAPISPELLAFMRGIGIDIREVWGMSETTGAATIQPPFSNSEGRVGGPIQGIDLKIAEDGELLVRGGIVFKGYYRNLAASEDALQDGWLHTGDVAEMRPDGSISIVDRKKDIMINAAGKNLAPSLIENTIKASPYIKEAIIIADRRPYVTALIQIDMETVRLWAEANGMGYTTYRSLTEAPQVRVLIDEEVDRLNADLARVEQVKKVHLLAKELDHDDGEVTATMKVRRASIQKAYASEIEALYQNTATAARAG
ncbi:MAG: long-chain fatty acid--CoA ligase [Pseudomonadota bacterium]